MPGQLVPFGPWPGGLNNRNSNVAPDLVRPDELRFCLNLDVLDSGVLQARPGARKCGSTAMYTDLSGSGTFALLGSIEQGGKQYALVSPHNGGSPGTSTFYYTTGPSTAANWTAVPGGSLSGKFATSFQYGGFTYIVGTPSGGATGQRRADITAGVWASVAALPAGQISAIIRDRAFVIDQTACRVYFSKATDPTTWAAPDGGFFDVDPGAGTPVTAAVVVNSQLYVFKRNRTYLFTFTTDPAVDGQLTLLNAQLGAYSVALWTNSIYLVNSQSVYRLLNNFFTDIGSKMDAYNAFNLDALVSPETVINVEGDRLVVGPHPAPFLFTHGAINLHTGAWMARRYQNASTVNSTTGPSTKSITWRDTGSVVVDSTGNIYGHGKRLLSFTRVMSSFGFSSCNLDIDDDDRVVSPEYSMSTTEYAAGDYDVWKRMHWLATQIEEDLPVTDNPVQCRVCVGPNVNTPVQTVTAPTSGTSPEATGGKVPLTAFRFRSVVFQLIKSQKDLGASPGFDANTNSYLVVRRLLSRVSSSSAQVSVN